MVFDSSISTGIVVGLAVAVGQSLISIVAMRWAWKKSFFYWVWGGGLLFRLLVFSLTAFVVYKYTDLNLVAVLLALVTVTTGTLVLESIFRKKK